MDLGTYGAAVAPEPGASNGSNGSAGAVVAHVAARAARVAAPSVPLAIVAVASGDGLARIFESFGVAAVVRGGQSNNPSTGELLDAVERIAADEILLLPNNPNVVLAARQATEMTTRRVRVVPTRNAAEGFAALLALDPARDATANAEVMTLAGRAVQTLQVTEAVRDATVGGQQGARRARRSCWTPTTACSPLGSDRMRAILTALEALDPGFELITIYYGEGADLSEAEASRRPKSAKWRPAWRCECSPADSPTTGT